MGNRRGGIRDWWVGSTAAGALLILPLRAAWELGVGWRWSLGYTGVLSAIAWWAYARDKRRATEGLWRVPEAWLHGLAMLGGWPGALLAQRVLRHKSSKIEFQAVFWGIVLGFELLALEVVRGWPVWHWAVGKLGR